MMEEQPVGTPEEVCAANGHDFVVTDTDYDGEPLYLGCARIGCDIQWSVLGRE